ncbi:hypothetical protein ARALYDRAFT_898536 [Arabidopsis lyrata subsp. lyrata]|uniref:Uncharacterized protein n=1 Tax=Arabidopsis lyrata subsp. lyrata TaxID=81972 RepID=D7KZY8_ARALL|nr:hypothetical protein ARALYDRAFT_898536 [Arabidopsis lyrata subsp. lyrata]
MNYQATILAIFMIVLVLDCDDAMCVTMCKQKWKGSGGSCFQNVNLKSCLCAFPCQV